MKKGIGTAIAVVLGGLGLYAGFQYLRAQYLLGYEYWEVKINQFKVNSLSNNNADLTLTLKVANPTDVAVSIGDIDIDVYYKGKFLVNAKRQESFRILPRSTAKVDIDFSLSYGEATTLFTQFTSDFLGQKPLVIVMDGSFRVKGLGVPFTVDFENQPYEYSADLSKDLGVSAPISKVKGWLNDNLGLQL